jgi:hypothetical protein
VDTRKNHTEQAKERIQKLINDRRFFDPALSPTPFPKDDRDESIRENNFFFNDPLGDDYVQVFTLDHFKDSAISLSASIMLLATGFFGSFSSGCTALFGGTQA